jgi:hypothetical protein
MCISHDWASTGIKALLGFIPENVGVVGPTLIYSDKKIYSEHGAKSIFPQH